MKWHYDISYISRYRQGLMGIATIMIILCHSVARGVKIPSTLAYLFSLGNYGVDIFLFLSGVGIYYSLSKVSLGRLSFWYFKRYTRILLPYLLIMIPYYVWFCYINHLGWRIFLLDVSTLGFWLWHEGAWFVAFLIPLYLISPILFIFIKQLNEVKWQWVSDCLVLVLCFALCLVYKQDTSTGFFNNLAFASRRAPSYLLGLWCAPAIMEGKNMSWLLILFLTICGILFTKWLPSFFPGWLLVIPALCVLSLLLHNIKCLNKVACFFGRISLESYLTNITLPVLVLWFITNFGLSEYNRGNYLMYLVSVILGIAISLVVNNLSKRILNLLSDI